MWREVKFGEIAVQSLSSFVVGFRGPGEIVFKENISRGKLLLECRFGIKESLRRRIRRAIS